MSLIDYCFSSIWFERESNDFRDSAPQAWAVLTQSTEHGRTPPSPCPGSMAAAASTSCFGFTTRAAVSTPRGATLKQRRQSRAATSAPDPRRLFVPPRCDFLAVSSAFSHDSRRAPSSTATAAGAAVRHQHSRLHLCRRGAFDALRCHAAPLSEDGGESYVGAADVFGGTVPYVSHDDADPNDIPTDTAAIAAEEMVDAIQPPPLSTSAASSAEGARGSLPP